ncbi:MAG: MBL fold metallo-hydrolase [Deltaproteobacteria bacterium]|nr:MBL fold metallo-hydrolase [Deltaproteobacteria bacterium]
MADLLALSSRLIDEGTYEGPGSVNRVTTEISEVADGIAMIEAFSHVVAFDSGDGLVLFDTSLETFAEPILKSLRSWSTAHVRNIAYTHGHVDHVGGAQAFVEEAKANGAPPPALIGHENLPLRFDRYALTNGYNAIINQRQFGGGRVTLGSEDGGFGPSTWVRPETTFRDRMRLSAGELEFVLQHSKGETDDHLWAWVPERKAICTGDLVIWVFPNAGNPQKVQRYPLEWSRALREMAALDAELLLPAHGLPISGTARIQRVLDDMATALEMLVDQTLRMMNDGARLDEIVHSVKLPAELLEKPYLRPTYDEPEFIVHNIWRLYGGWYDGNPAHLKPAPDAALGSEVAALAGGVPELVSRARELAAADDLRLACQLVELATQAEPGNRDAHAARAEIYTQRRKAELSLMARGIYGHAARESQAIAETGE